jgi:hypothetical protein
MSPDTQPRVIPWYADIEAYVMAVLILFVLLSLGGCASDRVMCDGARLVTYPNGRLAVCYA